MCTLPRAHPLARHLSLSQPLTASHWLSLALTGSHRLSQALTGSHWLSQALTVSHRLSQPSGVSGVSGAGTGSARRIGSAFRCCSNSLQNCSSKPWAAEVLQCCKSSAQFSLPEMRQHQQYQPPTSAIPAANISNTSRQYQQYQPPLGPSVGYQSAHSINHVAASISTRCQCGHRQHTASAAHR